MIFYQSLRPFDRHLEGTFNIDHLQRRHGQRHHFASMTNILAQRTLMYGNYLAGFSLMYFCHREQNAIKDSRHGPIF